MQQPSKRRIGRTLGVLLPLAIGIAVAALLVAGRTPPGRGEEAEIVRTVAVIEAPEVRWRPRATGFGEARPAQTWRAVTEVSGRIVERNAELESGAILPAGTLLFRIDRTDHVLAVREAEASIAARRAQLEELQTRRANLERSLEIERRRLAVAERELARQQRLAQQGTVSEAELDQQERATLQQRQAVQELQNSLAQIPAERNRLEAELARDTARLDQARRNLPRTKITAPFDLRVSRVAAETGQFVRTGEVLMEGDGIDASEVEAEIPVQQFRGILSPIARPDGDAVPRLDELLSRMNLSAEIRLRASGDTGAPVGRWDARVDRISDAIDARTRTVGVVAVVDQPYRNARPPEQPPLVKGMYVEVRLCAPARPAAVVVPRAALHEGRVYLAGEDGRLAVREPVTGFRHGGFVVIEHGIAPGERVLVSDPVPAIAGMKLAPRPDPAAREALVAEARGALDCP